MNPDYSLDSPFVRELDLEIKALIKAGPDGDRELFEELAFRSFELHYHANESYRNFCNKKGIKPGCIDHWNRIHPVPTSMFKDNVLASFPESKAAEKFFTSGTTVDTGKGSILKDERGLELTLLANRIVTKEYLFPDLEERIRMLLLVPSPEIAPGMGMARGLLEAKKEFGTEDSAFLITKEGMDIEALLKGIKESEESGRPICIVGATGGFVHLSNYCDHMKIKFHLPEGSRICDGGGYSGRFGYCPPEEHIKRCVEYFEVPESMCVNTYGMAESATNYFDNSLRDAKRGIKNRRRKEDLPWTRTIIVNPETFEQVPFGETGLLCHYDLCNRPMILGVQTDNLGRLVEGGFEILGRYKNKDAVPVTEEMIGHGHSTQ